MSKPDRPARVDGGVGVKMNNQMILGLVFLLLVIVCVYLLFFWRDPAIERYERGLEEAEEKKRKRDIETINERNRMAVALRAWETGKSQYGEVDDAGNLTVTEINSLDDLP